MQPTHNTLSETIRMRSIDILNAHLASAIDLHAQVKQAHWNVRGTNFIAIHKLFDAVAEEVEDWSDMLAERASGLGGPAHGTVKIATERSYLNPYPLNIADWPDHVFAIASALAAFGEKLRLDIAPTADLGDPATSDLLTEITRGVDHQLWFVEAHAAPANSSAQSSAPKAVMRA
jgi:starvation-inducible DNA-binding protein